MRPHTNPQQPSLNRLAVSATTPCLTGCGLGEVLGLVIATAFGRGNAASIAVAALLACSFGYALTMLPLLRSGMAFAAATGLALAADTLSIAVTEIVDNGVMLAIPSSMEAGLTSLLFWGSMAVALAIAWIVAFPVNRWPIARGLGHARVHGCHGHGSSHQS